MVGFNHLGSCDALNLFTKISIYELYLYMRIITLCNLNFFKIFEGFLLYVILWILNISDDDFLSKVQNASCDALNLSTKILISRESFGRNEIMITVARLTPYIRVSIPSRNFLWISSLWSDYVSCLWSSNYLNRYYDRNRLKSPLAGTKSW